MIEIQPVPVGYPAQQAVGLKVKLLPFGTDATTCSTYYQLFTVEVLPLAEGETEPKIVEKQVAEGNYTLTEDEYNSWGDDNTVVEDAVLNHLQLTRK